MLSILTLVLSLSHAAPQAPPTCVSSPETARLQPLGRFTRIGDWISNRMPGPKSAVHAGVPDAAAKVLETWSGQRFGVRVVYGRASRAAGERKPSHRKKTLAVFEGLLVGVTEASSHRGLRFRIDKSGSIGIKGLRLACAGAERISITANALAEEALSIEANGEGLFVTVWPRQLAHRPDDRWIGLSMTLSTSQPTRLPVPEARSSDKSRE